MVDVRDEFERGLKALALEVPDAVYVDLKRRADALLAKHVGGCIDGSICGATEHCPPNAEAEAYRDAVAALQEVTNLPLSTTIGHLIRQGYLVVGEPSCQAANRCERRSDSGSSEPNRGRSVTEPSAAQEPGACRECGYDIGDHDEETHAYEPPLVYPAGEPGVYDLGHRHFVAVHGEAGYRWWHDCPAVEHVSWGWIGRVDANQQSGHRIVSHVPTLTVEGSLLCTDCGDHGFIRETKWVPA